MASIWFICALAVASATPAPAPNLATTRLLVDAIEKGARCLDGSPVRYWIQRASGINSTKWSVHHMGGGWCESVEECATRAYGKKFDGDNCYIGSSNVSCFGSAGARNKDNSSAFNETMDFRNIPSCQGARWCGGLMMNDPFSNPLAHDWNKVLLPYCDGGSFGGNNMSVTYTELRNTTRPLYFRGFRNLNAVIDDLLAHEGLSDATDVLVSGDSAGGLATYWHADHYKFRLPKAKVVAAPDSGFFYNDVAYPSWSNSLRWVVQFMNATSGLSRSCTQALAVNGGDQLDCRFPEIAAKYTKVPLFIMQGRYDHVMDSIVGGVSAGDNATINRMGKDILALVKMNVLDKPQNAAFITSCEMHCGQWAQGQEPIPNSATPVDYNVTIDGWTATQALDAWYGMLEDTSGASRSRSLWLQEATYPCKNCCYGGQVFKTMIV